MPVYFVNKTGKISDFLISIYLQPDVLALRDRDI